MRSAVAATIGGAAAVALMWWLASAGASHLRAPDRVPVETALLLVALLTATPGTWLIARKSSEGEPYGCAVGVLCGAVCGFAYALTMGIAYVTTFGGAPVSFIDGALVLLSYPVFALLGAFVGAVPGCVFGMLAAYTLARLTPKL